ncbi:NAD(P)-dependent oxidoreductase [Lacticaseibacillus absianus]|uniref:NAD(P)-dependent oxidoreductase n=1 Tax=Lacticaseibacillus absianus TaxID=2729623 RepID=UPI0015CC0005|nr:NAD(P)-dependent oxidoreductase [Lacticaseibacillus absianus]
MQIGFIGTGVMGTGIIRNLLKAGYPVVVFNRTQAHAEAALTAGATWATSPRAVAEVSDLVFTMVGFPQDVEHVYFDADGLFVGARAGQLLIDMTTSTPRLAQTIARTAASRGITALDAPVSGGDIGARSGTLTVMLGGEPGAIARLAPLLTVIAQSWHRFGGPGAGQHAKLANQIMIAGTMTGLTEMLVYAKAAGLDPSAVLTTVGSGAGANWSMTNYGPRILAGDYTPGFFAKHFLKDLRIALDEATAMGLTLPATAQAEALYQAMVDAGRGALGTQGLILNYE